MNLSVVVPARNEELWLPLCLDSLTKQSLPPNEIIVVDNGSTDNTAQVARAYGCTVVSEPTPGVGRARYTGCRIASGDIIATTDADTCVPEDWTAKIIATFRKQPTCVGVTGPWHLFDGSTFTKWFTILHAQAVLRAMALCAPATVNMLGCNSAFRTEAYRQVGGFRPDLKRGEDLNLSLRLRSVGHVRYIPSMAVHTSGRRFQKSFFTGIGQYIPDATRQVTAYLAGRREVPQQTLSIGAGVHSWMLPDGTLAADMGLNMGLDVGMETDFSMTRKD